MMRFALGLLLGWWLALHPPVDGCIELGTNKVCLYGPQE